MTWKIKVSQNFAFNENEELRLKTSSNVPGLPAKWELLEHTTTRLKVKHRRLTSEQVEEGTVYID